VIRLTSLHSNTLYQGSGHAPDALVGKVLDHKGKPPRPDDGLHTGVCCVCVCVCVCVCECVSVVAA
jgi:hypothetical protein